MVCVTQACLGACSILSILSIKTGRIVLWCHVLSLRRISHDMCRASYHSVKSDLKCWITHDTGRARYSGARPRLSHDMLWLSYPSYMLALIFWLSCVICCYMRALISSICSHGQLMLALMSMLQGYVTHLLI